MSKQTNQIIRKALDLVKPQFRLPLDHGYHGIAHWVRVWANAEMLCKYYNTDPDVPCWFAFLHDSQRHNEGRDPYHGERATWFALKHWRAGDIRLNADDLRALMVAMEGHSEGRTQAFIKTRICWDADRLDLGRCDIRPDPGRLCTAYAREPEVIEAAFRRSRGWDH